MNFPYGVSNFYKVINEEHLYFDRTDRIPQLEAAGSQLLFLRPRRFGKSLLVSMLENYYDLRKADDFEKLFGHLAIGKNPTPLHNQYFVLHWDFSWVETLGDLQQIRQSLHNHINGQIQSFANRYRYLLSYPVDIDHTDALSSFRSMLSAIQETPHKLYLFIDEYDSTANELLLEPRIATRERFESLVSSEGVLRLIFKAVKAATANMGLDRIFITGVSPAIMGDVMSGFDDTRRIDGDLEFADLCGLRESELSEPLRLLAEECAIDQEKIDEAQQLMRTWYSGYTFHQEQQEPLYNTAGVLYFMQELHKRLAPPAQLVDNNGAPDRNRLAHTFGQQGGAALVLTAFNENAPLSIDTSENRFGLSLTSIAPKDPALMARVLHDFGMLTLAGQDGLGKSLLCIPNLMMRRFYAEHIRETLLIQSGDKAESLTVTETFYSTGDMRALCGFLEETIFELYRKKDFGWTNELTIKSLFLSLLWNERLYLMDWEPALQQQVEEGFVAMTNSMAMMRRPDTRRFQALDFLFEFRQVSLDQVGLSVEELATLAHDKLHELPAVAQALQAAIFALESNRDRLISHYPNRLKLRCYVVVSIGSAQLLWEEHSPIGTSEPSPLVVIAEQPAGATVAITRPVSVTVDEVPKEAEIEQATMMMPAVTTEQALVVIPEGAQTPEVTTMMQTEVINDAWVMVTPVATQAEVVDEPWAKAMPEIAQSLEAVAEIQAEITDAQWVMVPSETAQTQEAAPAVQAEIVNVQEMVVTPAMTPTPEVVTVVQAEMLDDHGEVIIVPAWVKEAFALNAPLAPTLMEQAVTAEHAVWEAALAGFKASAGFEAPKAEQAPMPVGNGGVISQVVVVPETIIADDDDLAAWYRRSFDMAEVP